LKVKEAGVVPVVGLLEEMAKMAIDV